jgi:uncharacterized protein (TIGR03085 family)
MSVSISFADSERAYLSDALEALGPDAPTLCEGWTTADLAAHLIIRERRPDAAIGIVLPALASRTEKVMAHRKARPWTELVDQVRSGPPAWSPLGLPAVAGLANSVEYFVHHEDIRRAQPGWEPRELDADVEDLLWSRLVRQGRLMFRRVGAGVVLARSDKDETRSVRAGSPVATVTGLASELTLLAFGRRSAARVKITGDPAARSALESASLGL